jgi:hypothetical protein
VIEMTESKAMKEIHEIRERNYEETKNMSREEYIKSIKERASHSKLKVMNEKKATVKE